MSDTTGERVMRPGWGATGTEESRRLVGRFRLECSLIGMDGQWVWAARISEEPPTYATLDSPRTRYCFPVSGQAETEADGQRDAETALRALLNEALAALGA